MPPPVQTFTLPRRYLVFALASWLGLMLWLLAKPAWAAPNIVEVGPQTQQLALGAKLQVLEDRDGLLDFDAVLRADAQFRPSRQAVPNFGFTRSVWWFRVRLKSRVPEQHDWLLENQYPLLDRLDLYIRSADGQLQYLRGGRSLPFNTRQVVHPNLIFRLPLAYGQQTDIYLRVQTGSSLQLPLVLWNPQSFSVSDRHEQVILAALYGLLFAMFAYNLMLYLSLRDPGYFYYVLYVGTFGLFQFALNGLAFEYLWPDSPQWGQRAIPMFLALALAAMLRFSRLFLQLERYLPRLDTALQLLQWALLLAPPALFALDYSPVIRSVTLVGLLASVLICATGWYVWLRCRLAQARYFVLAWSALLAGMLLYALKTINLLPATFITSYALQIGAGLEVLLLSFALAHRLKLLEAENKRIQREYAAELAQQVEQRTAQLDQAMHRLVATNKELEAFSYTVSHDLRAPLRAIGGFSRTLLEDCAPRLNEEDRHYLQRINNAAQRMSELINALLELAKVSRSEIRAEPLNLSEIASEVLTDLLSLYPQRQVELVVMPNVTGNGDRKLLRNVLQNLLGNALKFSAGNPHNRVEFGAELSGGRMVYRVCDNGAGFDMRYVDRLFGAFQRLHDDRQFEGTGVGLASVQRIIHRHGGDVWAEARVGEGACFYFTLE